MSPEHRTLLEAACAAARAAATVILEVYAHPFDVRHKADASPVTQADERAEAVIIERLRAAAPDIPIIAEEQAAAQGLAEPPPPRFWLVDPLDGTREFVKRNGEFTVNIGLVEAGRVVLGVMQVPAAGLLYSACGPGTALRQEGDAAPQAIAARPPPAAGAVLVHSRSHADLPRLEAFAARFVQVKRRVAGSAVKFCLIAAGEADYYPRFGRTMEWDTAAGQAILEAAGGRVETLDGRPLVYAKPGFANPEFLARGRMG